jgi:hypothetical protein
MKRLLRFLPMAFVLLAIGIGPAQAQNRDRWGINDGSGFNPITAPSSTVWGPPEMDPGGYARAYEAGFGWTRYVLYWNQLNPSNGTYRFDLSDFGINGAVSKGVQVYANINWAPSWAVGGTHPLTHN